MRQPTCLALVTLCGFLLAGCAIVYRLPTRQGNVIEQSELSKLQLGMTKQQVSYILGTPIASSPFESNRWDYYGYYKPPRGKASSRDVSLFFDDSGKLTRMVGVNTSNLTVAPTAPDKATLALEKKEAENPRQSGGPPRPGGGGPGPL